MRSGDQRSSPGVSGDDRWWWPFGDDPVVMAVGDDRWWWPLVTAVGDDRWGRPLGMAVGDAR